MLLVLPCLLIGNFILKAHHSSEEMNLTTAMRQPILEGLGKIVFPLLLLALTLFGLIGIFYLTPPPHDFCC